jgi:hypothetical protein
MPLKRKRPTKPDALERALEEADRRAEWCSIEQIFQLGKSPDARERLLALAIARRRMELGDPPATYFQFARDLIDDPDNNCRWQAVIVVGESIDADPDAVWDVVNQFGDHADADMRMAIATCLLEHLLDKDFDSYFPKVRREILNGRSLMIDTLRSSWFGERDDPNFKKLQAFVRNARRGRSE